jgi:hypothetical protein
MNMYRTFFYLASTFSISTNDKHFLSLIIVEIFTIRQSTENSTVSAIFSVIFKRGLLPTLAGS